MPPLVRDHTAWLTAILVAFVSACTLRQILRLGALPVAAAVGGPGTFTGATVVGMFAAGVAGGRVFPGLDRWMAWLVVVAAAMYWLVELAIPNSIAAPTGGVPGDFLFVAGLGLPPFLVAAILLLPRVKPTGTDLVLFGLDVLIVGLSSGMLLLHLILDPVGYAAGADALRLIFVTIHPAADLALIFLAIAATRIPVPGVSLPVKQLLVLAFVFVFASSLSLAIQALTPSPSTASLAGLFQAWFWTVIAVISVVLVRDRSADEDQSEGRIPSFSWLPYAAISVAFVVPAIGSWGNLGALEEHIPASGLLIMLVLLRLGATARENAALVASGAARRTEARFHALVQNGSDLVMVTDSDSRIRYITPSAARVLGRVPDSLEHFPLTELLHPEDAAMSLAIMAEVAAVQGATRRAEWRLRRADGSYCETEIVASNMLGVPEVAGLVLTARDIGDRKALERQLTFQALHDPLTGLANRSLLADRVEHALVRTRRRRGVVAVLFLDLDDFKQINDGHGHSVGDRLLVAVAERIASVLRNGDTVSRVGGDEFAVLLEDLASADEAADLAGRVADSLGEPFEIDGLQAFASASIGIAVGRGADVDAEELLRNADVAMYVAKAKGKRRTETFDPSMYKEVQDRLTLEADLRRAVERDEFEVFYQPVWATNTRRMVGVEALVRWRHPSRGLLAPADFIGAAEETGLIVPMGRIVLDRACAQVAAWDHDGGAAAGLSIAVNISPRQLREADLVETIAHALSESGLAADRLNLEITEAVLVDDSAIVADLLRQLKTLGVRISIDDFGTGYSSLSYLKRLPIDVLKIAKPFVDVITNGPRDEALSQAIVSLARSLQLEVVAEGIEQQSQLDALLGMGCELGQGYLVSPPVPADRLPDLAAAPDANAA